VDHILTSDGALEILQNGIGASPSMKVRLFSNNLTAFTKATVLGDLTEASFTGYAAASPTWSAPALSSGVAQTLGGTAPFTYTGVSSTVVYGYYLTDSAGTKFYGGNLFPAPQTLDTVTTTLSMQVTLNEKSEFG
jgi:hypothetical protein